MFLSPSDHSMSWQWNTSLGEGQGLVEHGHCRAPGVGAKVKEITIAIQRELGLSVPGVDYVHCVDQCSLKSQLSCKIRA